MDAGQAFFEIIANPNVAYLLFILGLLAMVVALTVPGTGLVEVVAGVCLILAVVGLSRLPVNVAGIVLILLGIGLLIVDIKVQSGLVALGGALLLGAGSLFLFRPNEQAIAVSGWLIGLTTVGAAAFFGFGVNRAMRAMRLHPAMTEDNLIGIRGVIKAPLSASNHFTGAALIGSELWTVKSDRELNEGAPVVVERVEGLTLMVHSAADETADLP
jgi:membrane-bound serine protease (ClpP class)